MNMIKHLSTNECENNLLTKAEFELQVWITDTRFWLLFLFH